MNTRFSAAWRAHGAERAFDHAVWEGKSRQFHSSALLLLKAFEEGQSALTSEVIMALSTAQYLLAMSLELISKAYFLRRKLGEPEAIYTHSVIDLIAEDLLSEPQRKLLRHAAEYVVWAGRYPTPKWTKEKDRQRYDVPSALVDGVEHIDAMDMANGAWLQRCEEYLDLHAHIRGAWAAA